MPSLPSSLPKANKAQLSRQCRNSSECTPLFTLLAEFVQVKIHRAHQVRPVILMSIDKFKTGLLGRYLHFLLQEVGTIPPDETAVNEDEATRPTDEVIRERLSQCIARIDESVRHSPELEAIEAAFKE